MSEPRTVTQLCGDAKRTIAYLCPGRDPRAKDIIKLAKMLLKDQNSK